MSKVKIALVAVIVLVIVTIYTTRGKSMAKKSTRDADIDAAIEAIFAIKKYHHDKIVDALEEGASESEHVAMLDQKRRDVIQAMEETERNFNIIIDKNDPTEPGPVVVLSR